MDRHEGFADAGSGAVQITESSMQINIRFKIVVPEAPPTLISTVPHVVDIVERCGLRVGRDAQPTIRLRTRSRAGRPTYD